jgi:hypothetical protein
MFMLFLVFSNIVFFSYKKLIQLKILGIYLIFLSINMRFCNFLFLRELFNFQDLFGNLLGVLIILILFYFFIKNENSKN